MDHRSIPTQLKIEYRSYLSDRNLKTLDGIQDLLSRFRTRDTSIDAILKEAADLISRQFGIDNVAIGLKDPSDGLYRYMTMIGLRESAIEGHTQIAYSREQFYDCPEFKGSDISKYSRIYLEEDNELTDQELRAFNRPSLLKAKRKSLKDCLEGDYVDTKILGPDDDLMGWIEISGTRMMKLPDALTIRWVEVIASIIGAALVSHGMRKLATKQKGT